MMTQTIATTMTTATAMTTTTMMTIATAMTMTTTTAMTTTMTTATAGTTMTTTKRASGEVRFLATKAIVGGLSVATFVGAWVLIAATAGGAKAEDGPETAGFGTASGAAAQAPAVIERQVIYYVVGTNTESQLPPLRSSSVPAASLAPQAPAAPPAPKAVTKQVAKKSRGS
jgi:hypothetical protein